MFEIRPANKKDAKQILQYIKELAIVEKFPFGVTVTLEDIEKNLFGSHPVAEALICYFDKILCGFAVFYETFSTTTGKKGLHLDDLYIEPTHQGKGFGKKVLSHLAYEAISRGCARFEWWVLKTNDKAIKFYKSIGAKQLDEISIFRMDNETLTTFAANISNQAGADNQTN